MTDPVNERLINVIAEVMENEEGEGRTVHTMRCQFDGPRTCTCLHDMAALIVERMERLVVEMKEEEAAQQMLDDAVEVTGISYVAVGHGEDPPWIDLPNTCPVCGQENLPLQQSNPPMLQFISHCGKSWMRGPLIGDRA